MNETINPWAGADLDLEDLEEEEESPDYELWEVEGEVAKGLSPAYGHKRKRTAKLVRNLKRARRYAPPVRGGTGKQARTRRNKFSG